MYYLNKVVGAMTNPACLAWVLVLIALVLRAANRRKVATWMLVGAVAWVWIWATPLMSRIVGVTLERAYLVNGKVLQMEDCPLADAIELHGGSMGVATNICSRGEMWGGADRVWMAARLWKAGKAPKIFVTGTGCPASTIGLLEDFGVPTNALVVVEGPRNTEEEARFIASRLPAARVLVVTSAWHMRRTMLMYEKYAPGIEAIPVACDFENAVNLNRPASLVDLVPTEVALHANCVAVHEWVGILGYRYFR